MAVLDSAYWRWARRMIRVDLSFWSSKISPSFWSQSCSSCRLLGIQAQARRSEGQPPQAPRHTEPQALLWEKLFPQVCPKLQFKLLEGGSRIVAGVRKLAESKEILLGHILRWARQAFASSISPFISALKTRRLVTSFGWWKSIVPFKLEMLDTRSRSINFWQP